MLYRRVTSTYHCLAQVVEAQIKLVLKCGIDNGVTKTGLDCTLEVRQP